VRYAYSALQHSRFLFRIGASKQSDSGIGNAERSGGFEIDNRLNFHGLDRQSGPLGSHPSESGRYRPAIPSCGQFAADCHITNLHGGYTII
jgi:hypothetical protein